MCDERAEMGVCVRVQLLMVIYITNKLSFLEFIEKTLVRLFHNRGDRKLDLCLKPHRTVPSLTPLFARCVEAV